MPGEVSALLSAICYAISILLLKKGQTETLRGDNGLFPLLSVSAVILVFNLALDLIDDPEPLIHGESWMPSVAFCALSGIIATLFGRLALYAAVAKIGATRGIIITAMAPLVTFVVAFFVLGEIFSPGDAIGMAVLMSGIMVLVLERNLTTTRSHEKLYENGLFLAVSACTLQGIGFAFRKMGVALPIDPIFASCLDVVAALLLYMMLLALSGRLRTYTRFYIGHLNLYILTAAFTSAAAVFLFFNASSSIPVSQVSIIIGSQPVIAAILSGIFMRDIERVTWMTIVSSILVTFGVVLLGS